MEQVFFALFFFCFKKLLQSDDCQYWHAEFQEHLYRRYGSELVVEWKIVNHKIGKDTEIFTPREHERHQ